MGSGSCLWRRGTIPRATGARSVQPDLQSPSCVRGCPESARAARLRKPTPCGLIDEETVGPRFANGSGGWGLASDGMPGNPAQMPRRASLHSGLMSMKCFRLGMESAVPLREADGAMVKLDLDPSLPAQRCPTARRPGKVRAVQFQRPSAISRAIMARAFIITSSPEVSI